MAQSVIGALRVNLGLDSAQFERGAKRAQSSSQKMAEQMRRVAAVGAAAFAALGAAAFAGARDIDQTAKAARRVGSSIAGFEALKLAASEAGVPLSALPNELQNVNRELANIGVSGNADRALDRLGLSAEQLAGVDADEKIAIIADRVKELGLTSGEATAVLRDLGVRNREMVLLLQGGGDAIRTARKDIEDYGLAIGGPAVAAVERANDRIGRLSIVSRVFGQQLAFAIVPAVGRFATRITESVREGGALRSVINALANVGRVFAAVIDLASENLDFLIDLFKIFVGAKIVTFVAAVGRSMIVLARSIRATGLIMVAFTSITRAKITALALLAAVVAKVTGTYESLTGWLRETGDALLDALPEELKSGIDGLGDKIMGLGDSLLETAGIAENDFLNAELNAADAAGSFGDAARGASKGAEQITKSLEDSTGAAQTFRQSFGDMVADVVTGARSMADVLKELGGQLIRKGINGLVDGLFDGDSGSGVFKSIREFLSFDGGGFTGFGARAGGLDGKGGFPAILHPNETVIDHTKGQMAGGVATIRLIAPEGFTAAQEGRAYGIAVDVVSQGLSEYDRTTLPKSVDRIRNDPLRVG